MATLLFVIMICLLIFGFPMMMPLLASTLIGFKTYYPAMPDQFIIQQMIYGIKPAALVAVPMFILAADIMTRGQTANRLLDLVSVFFGHLKGGLPITSAISCTLFGAVSGSTQATVVAIGKPLRPKLLQAGYPEGFTNGLLINASDIALLIPPSIGMIFYGVVSGTSIGELFIAGIGPGVLILFLFSAYCVWVDHKCKIKKAPKANWTQKKSALKKSILPLGFPLIIIGGIYSGLFSPTEAAAVSVLYALILEMIIFRHVSFKDLYDIGRSTGMITAVVFILVAAGACFSWLISFAQIPQDLILNNLQLSASSNVYYILAITLVCFFVGCMFVDPLVVILILTPIFHPIATSAGIDPVLIGTLVTLQVAIGSATPPFGCDIFTAIAVFKRPYLKIISGIGPFVLILILSTILIVLFPQIALFLRDLAFNK